MEACKQRCCGRSRDVAEAELWQKWEGASEEKNEKAQKIRESFGKNKQGNKGEIYAFLSNCRGGGKRISSH